MNGEEHNVGWVPALRGVRLMAEQLARWDDYEQGTHDLDAETQHRYFVRAQTQYETMLSSHGGGDRQVQGALRNTIQAHGPITEAWIGSAAKRIAKNVAHRIGALEEERLVLRDIAAGRFKTQHIPSARSIRYGVPHDLPYIAAFYPSVNADDLREAILGHRVLVACPDGQAIGYALTGWLWDNTPMLYHVQVSEKYRRDGWGSGLVDSWAEVLQREEHSTFLASVNDNDETASTFIKHCAFTACGNITFLSLNKEVYALNLQAELSQNS